MRPALLRSADAAAPSPLHVGRAQYGRTPLHIAAQYGHAAACTALLENGADVNAKEKVRALSPQRNKRSCRDPLLRRTLCTVDPA